MGNFLSNIFNNSKEVILRDVILELKSTIVDLRQDKVFLQDQIKDLITKLDKHPPMQQQQPIKSNTTLTKLESKVYKTINDLNTLDTAKLSEVLNLKETSLKVYISRIKSKGHSLNHLDN